MNKTLQNLSRFRATGAIATGRGAMFETLHKHHSGRFFINQFIRVLHTHAEITEMLHILIY
jgi:hypothetical protein